MAGLYLHIPFCKHRCVYCGFYSNVLGKAYRKRYVEALCHELERRRTYLGQDTPLHTIYLGGGTPSLLDAEDLERLFGQIARLYPTDALREVTLEANPDDLSPEYIRLLRRLPIDRLSIGVQSLDDRCLSLLQRRHTAQQAIRAVQACQEAGFRNLSIDLMYGLPGQTVDGWNAELERALRLGVQHISAYALTYEEDTPLWKMRQEGRVCEAEEETSLRMFQLLMDRTADRGFEHYEISNFALPGYRAIHNTSYWTGEPYLGCGPAAHSFDGRSRQWNPADIRLYIQEEGNVPAEREELDRDTRYNELVITALRTREGIDLTRLEQDFGTTYRNYLLTCAAPHLQRETLCLEPAEDNANPKRLHLSRQGIFLSNDILSDLLKV